MNLTIYKYPIPKASGKFAIDLPEEARPLHVDVQEGLPWIWIEVDLDEPKKRTQFCVVYTSGTVPEDFVYVGTVLAHGGHLVLHIYRGAQ